MRDMWRKKDCIIRKKMLLFVYDYRGANKKLIILKLTRSQKNREGGGWMVDGGWVVDGLTFPKRNVCKWVSVYLMEKAVIIIMTKNNNSS